MTLSEAQTASVQFYLENWRNIEGQKYREVLDQKAPELCHTWCEDGTAQCGSPGNVVNAESHMWFLAAASGSSAPEEKTPGYSEPLKTPRTCPTHLLVAQ